MQTFDEFVAKILKYFIEVLVEGSNKGLVECLG